MQQLDSLVRCCQVFTGRIKLIFCYAVNGRATSCARNFMETQFAPRSTCNPLVQEECRRGLKGGHVASNFHTHTRANVCVVLGMRVSVWER